jgi:two-component system response regulator RegA
MLVVDDDAALRERMARAFADRGLDVRTAADGSKALELAREDSPELAVVDLKMPGPLSGLDVVRELKAIDATTRVLVLTGYGSIATAVEAMRLGAVNYVPKPADADEVLEAFDKPKGAPQGDEPLAPSLARAEWEHINRVLSDCGGNISEAARRLALHRRTLQRKLNKYPPSH